MLINLIFIALWLFLYGFPYDILPYRERAPKINDLISAHRLIKIIGISISVTVCSLPAFRPLFGKSGLLELLELRVSIFNPDYPLRYLTRCLSSL